MEKFCDICEGVPDLANNTIRHAVECPNHPDAIDDTPVEPLKVHPVDEKMRRDTLSATRFEPHKPAAGTVVSFALAQADKGSKPKDHPALAALDLARDWVREANLTPSHVIVFLARANEDGSDGIKFFQSGDYRSHAQVGMVIEGLDMMRGTGTYFEGD